MSIAVAAGGRVQVEPELVEHVVDGSSLTARPDVVVLDEIELSNVFEAG